jgi:periplasmic protein TonB
MICDDDGQKMNKISKFDDIVFELRNKDYGAYQLRKQYKYVVNIGIIMASLFVSLFVFLPFVLKPHPNNVLNGNGIYTSVHIEKLELPIEQIFVPPAHPPRQAVHVEEIVKYVPPVVVDSVPAFEKTQLSTEEYFNLTTNEENSITGTGTGEDLMSGQDGTETDEPFFIVEIMPSFKGGGLDRFSEWVQKRTIYPKEAFESKIKGTVSITFIVEKDGSVSNVEVVKGVHPLLDNEAVRVISESPDWSPGLQRGQPVRIRYLIPLVFSPD